MPTMKELRDALLIVAASVAAGLSIALILWIVIGP